MTSHAYSYNTTGHEEWIHRDELVRDPRFLWETMVASHEKVMAGTSWWYSGDMKMNWGEREREMKNGFWVLLKQLLFWNEKVWWRNRLKETGAWGHLADISSAPKFRTRMSHGVNENWRETQGWLLGKQWAGNSLNRSLWANNATVMTRFTGSQRLSWPPPGTSWARLPWKRLVVLQLCQAWGWSPKEWGKELDT